MSIDDAGRLTRIEKAFDLLCDAIKRRGTERDGNWGHKPFDVEIELIRQYAAGKLDGVPGQSVQEEK